jgi:hypothetical protein
MGRLRLRPVPRILLRLSLAGALALGSTISNAADPADESNPDTATVEGQYETSATRTSEPISTTQRAGGVPPGHRVPRHRCIRRMQSKT